VAFSIFRASGSKMAAGFSRTLLLKGDLDEKTFNSSVTNHISERIRGQNTQLHRKSHQCLRHQNAQAGEWRANN
jgi:hypothetical protein